MERNIRESVVLEHVVATLDKFRQCIREMTRLISAHMDQHRFPYMHTCEDMFSKCFDYEKENTLD